MTALRYLQSLGPLKLWVQDIVAGVGIVLFALFWFAVIYVVDGPSFPH